MNLLHKLSAFQPITALSKDLAVTASGLSNMANTASSYSLALNTLLTGVFSLKFPALFAPSTQTADRPLIIEMNLSEETFNPLRSIDPNEEEILKMMHAQLYSSNKDTAEPNLATSISVGHNGKGIQISLRKGGKWSDGKDLTADDLMFTLQVIYDEKSQAKQREDLLVGGQVPSFQKIDAYTVEMKLPEDKSSFLKELAKLYVLPKHALEKTYQEGNFAENAYNLGTNPESFVTNGAYRLTEYQPGKAMVFEANPFYHRVDENDNQLPLIKKVVIKLTPDLAK